MSAGVGDRPRRLGLVVSMSVRLDSSPARRSMSCWSRLASASRYWCSPCGLDPAQVSAASVTSSTGAQVLRRRVAAGLVEGMGGCGDDELRGARALFRSGHDVGAGAGLDPDGHRDAEVAQRRADHRQVRITDDHDDGGAAVRGAGAGAEPPLAMLPGRGRLPR